MGVTGAGGPFHIFLWNAFNKIISPENDPKLLAIIKNKHLAARKMKGKAVTRHSKLELKRSFLDLGYTSFFIALPLSQPKNNIYFIDYAI